MQIDRIYYPVQTLGYGKRIGIWTIGCTHHCKNCANPELWQPNPDKNISVDEIMECVSTIAAADGITITGGEPFEQPEELYTLVKKLNTTGYHDILVYSGYTIEELHEKGELVKTILKEIGVLVDGLYLDLLNDNKSFRGSSNQNIHILKDSLKERYQDAKNWERKTQILVNKNQIQAIGIPRKNGE